MDNISNKIFFKEAHEFIRGNRKYIEIDNGLNRLFNIKEIIVCKKKNSIVFSKLKSDALLK